MSIMPDEFTAETPTYTIDAADLREAILILKKKASTGQRRAEIRMNPAALEITYESIDKDSVITGCRLDADRDGDFYAHTGAHTYAVDLYALDKITRKICKLGGPITFQVAELTRGKKTCRSLSIVHAEIALRIDVARYGRPPELPQENTRIFNAERFARVLQSAAPAMTTDNARENIWGLLVGEREIVATDGFRLRVVPHGAEVDRPLRIAPEAVHRAIYAASKSDADEITIADVDTSALKPALPKGRSRHRITIGDVWIEYTAGHPDLYPDFRQVLPSFDPAHRVTMRSEDLLDAVKLLEPVSSTKCPSVRLTFDEAITAYTSDPELGAEATVDVEGEIADGASPRKAAFNPAFLVDVAKDLGDEIEVYPIDTLSPCRFQDVDADDGDFWVVMPMRL